MQSSLRLIFRTLLNYYGYQYWWPADSPIKVIMGAVLTQNSRWSSVEKIMSKVSKTDEYDLLNMGPEKLGELISGIIYAKRKAEYLHGLFAFLSRSLDYSHISRDDLLSIKGIGPETADSILLYGFNYRTVPIDYYTMRLFSRYFGIKLDKKDYEYLRSTLLKIFTNMELMEFHALIVEHSKRLCKKDPKCGLCPLTQCKSNNRSATNQPPPVKNSPTDSNVLTL